MNVLVISDLTSEEFALTQEDTGYKTVFSGTGFILDVTDEGTIEY